MKLKYIVATSVVTAVSICEGMAQTAELTSENLIQGSKELQEVVVTGVSGNTKRKDSPFAISMVGGDALREVISTNVVDAIASQPGVSQITTGVGISKPVIRGLGYNHVVTVVDGVRQEGQQWGAEHGIEVDGQDVQRVEILKGPASLRYGSDAMAGVLLMHGNPIVPEGELHANVAADYHTNNGLIGYTGNVSGNKNGWVCDARFSQKFAHAYQNKYDGYVLGSQFRETALSGMFGKDGRWGYSRLRGSFYNINPSISEGERDSATGKFVTEDGVASDKELKMYGRLLPFQQIYHYKVLNESMFRIGDGRLTSVVGYQQNRRQEFEESADEPALFMQLQTVNYDVHYSFPRLMGWDLMAGVGGMYQQSGNRDEEELIPDYQLFDVGGFVTFKRDMSLWNVSGGMRFDNRSLWSDVLNDGGHVERNYTGLTGSVGAVYHPTDGMNIRLNVARGFRAPNISELGSDGHHEGTLRYEEGNWDLKAEKSLQGDFGIDYASQYVDVELSLFVNRIDNYIYLERKGTEQKDGEDVYRYTDGEALLAGGEAMLTIRPVKNVQWRNSFSYVDARQLNPKDESQKYLPFTPMPRLTSGLTCAVPTPAKWIVGGIHATVDMEYNLRQDHYLKAYDSETSTPDYMLFNAMIGCGVKFFGKTRAKIHFGVENIFDKAYQNHLSRLKYADTNNVNGRSGVYEMGRNFVFRMEVPIGY